MGGGGLPEGAAGVVLPVVGQDALDGDAAGLEMGKRPFEEGGGGHAPLVGQGFCVGVAGVVVHGHMDVVEAPASHRLGAAVGLGEAGSEALPAAGGNAADLLDVEVNQFAGR